MGEWANVILAGAAVITLIIQTISITVIVMRALGKTEQRLTDKIAINRSELDEEIAVIRRERAAAIDQLRRDFEIVCAALRTMIDTGRVEGQRVREWVLENFSRRESVSAGFDRMDKRLDHIDQKLDDLSSRPLGHGE